MDPVEAALASTFIATLAAVTITDIDRRLIPDRILFASAGAAIAIVAAADPVELPARIAAAATAAGLLLVAALLRPDGMGLGDVKLAAVMGIYLGAAIGVALLIALALGATAGGMILVRHGAAARKRTIPLAPFLAAGGLAALAVGDELLAWYAHSMLQ